MKIDAAARLTDTELADEVTRLADGERSATVALIVHLGEFDARRLYEPAGFSSMFKYCRAVLHLSEGATYNRIEAARAARRHPVILDMLTDGRLSPTTARLLARHLTPENQQELLAAASWKGREEVEELLADRCPRPDVRSSVRKKPLRGPAEPAASERCPGPVTPPPKPVEDETNGGMSSGTVALGGVALPFDSVPARRGVVHPLGLERYEVRFMARATLREKLRVAQDLLAHAVPSADLAEVVERGVTLLIEDLSRRKFAATDRPRRSQVRERESTYVPAEVRRRVWRRDGGRCAFVAQSGRRCDARWCLEFHHVVPRATGGKATVDNIQLRCRAHNGHEVDLFFGPGKRYRRAEGRGTRPGTSTGVGHAGSVPAWARTPSP